MSTIEKAIERLRNKKAEPVADVEDERADTGGIESKENNNAGASFRASYEAQTAPLEKRQAESFVPISGTVHLNIRELRERGMLTPDANRSKLAEEYRLIKRPLLSRVDGMRVSGIESGNLIMVTSAIPGEGKTFSAINLAMSIAMEKDRTVILVDGDVAKPAAARMLGIEKKEGLTDLLVDKEAAIADFLVHTDVNNLSVLPAGRDYARATELLASERMRSLTRELSIQHPNQIVIFDSPPLLVASESTTLSDWMGQIVFVVAAESTSQHVVSNALFRVGEDRVSGMILNKYRPKIGAEYGYHYRYGAGYGDELSGANRESKA